MYIQNLETRVGSRAKQLLGVALMLAAAPLLHAAPIDYSFTLTVNELQSGGSKPSDPYYSQFFLGQTFNGTFTYDPDAAFMGADGGYRGALQYQVQIGDASVHNLPCGPTTGCRPSMFFNDSPAGTGPDGLMVFDEVPTFEGNFGPNTDTGYIEQFYFSLTDTAGSLLSSSTPGAINFSAFDGSLFNFWWQQEVTFSRLLIYGTVGNIHEVPEPATFGLFALGLAGVFVFARRRFRGVAPAL